MIHSVIRMPVQRNFELLHYYELPNKQADQNKRIVNFLFKKLSEYAGLVESSA